jgi:hypothetical protein
MKGTDSLGSKKEQERQATCPNRKKNCKGDETTPDDFSSTTKSIKSM